ncbi:MAG: EutN/CcmL family microcompartment protein [Chloroherpetonaceae bacterium]|nr:EutN/CcmL family microcompartment protein [Chloroherpetonaceae bacterium]
MLLCKVIGNTVATKKDEELRKAKLLVVKPIGLKREFLKSPEFIALDTLGAGIGDMVLVAQEGAVVEQVFKSPKMPANTIILAIVDDFQIAEKASI